MLWLIFILAVTASSLALSASEPLSEHQTKCINETGVNGTFIKEHSGMKYGHLLIPKTRSYAACVLREEGTVDISGTFQLEKISSKIPDDYFNRDKIVEGFTKCGDEVSNALFRERVYEFVRCVGRDEANKNFFPMLANLCVLDASWCIHTILAFINVADLACHYCIELLKMNNKKICH